MKLKFTLLSAFIVLCFTVKAQQIPNGGFETWTYYETPDGFSDNETLIQIIPYNFCTFQDTLDKTEGLSSVKIVSDTAPGFGILLPGFVAYGTATINGFSTTYTGSPFNGRPDSIAFDFKYSTPGTDTAILIIEGSQAGTPAINAALKLPLDTAWTHLTIALTNTYNPAVNGNLDTILLLFGSSVYFLNQNVPPTPGSTLHVDNIQMKYLSVATTINKTIDQTGLRVYPNPVSSTLNIKANKDLEGNNIQIFNLNGQLLSNKMLEGNACTVDMSDLSCGTYIYKITDKQNNVIDESKVSVIK